MSEKIWADDTWEDYLYWQSQDKKTIKGINQLIKDIERNGCTAGIENPNLYPVICLANTADVSTTKIDLCTIWKTDESILPTVVDITITNNHI